MFFDALRPFLGTHVTTKSLETDISKDVDNHNFVRFHICDLYMDDTDDFLIKHKETQPTNNFNNFFKKSFFLLKYGQSHFFIKNKKKSY